MTLSTNRFFILIFACIFFANAHVLQALQPLQLQHDDTVSSVAAVTTANGQPLFITGSLNSTAKIWTQNGHLVATLQHDDRIYSVAAVTTANGQTFFITGSNDNTAKIWPYEQIWAQRFAQSIDTNQSGFIDLYSSIDKGAL